MGTNIIDPRYLSMKNELPSDNLVKVYVDENIQRVIIATNYEEQEKFNEINWKSSSISQLPSKISTSKETEIAINRKKIQEYLGDARTYLTKAYEIHPIIYYLIPLVKVELSIGDALSALQLLTEHCNRFPTEIQSWTQLGYFLLHFSVGSSAQASKCFQIAKMSQMKYKA